jgi:hypothetical protein
VDSNDKERARLNIIHHLLSLVPYKAPKMDKIVLPRRKKPRPSRERELVATLVPEAY